MTDSVRHLSSLVLLACVACGKPTYVPDETQLAHRAPPLTGEVQAIEAVALANEGFLLRCGEQSVLIDAFLATGYAGADALPEPVLARLSAAEPPFDGVDLALISHEHGDHVQGRPARAFLAASPDTLLASSPQAVATVLGIIPGDGSADYTAEDLRKDMRDTIKEGDRDPIALEVHLPGPGKSSSVERNGVHVEFLRLSHGPRFVSIQNLGHIVTLGGQRVLHLGDAGTDARNFRPYGLADRALDVALIPYWYFLESDGRRLVDEHLRARLVIACHIPAGERTQVAETLAKSHPHVVVPREPLQSWTSEAP